MQETCDFLNNSSKSIRNREICNRFGQDATSTCTPCVRPHTLPDPLGRFRGAHERRTTGRTRHSARSSRASRNFLFAGRLRAGNPGALRVGGGRLRCVLQGGLAPRSAVTDSIAWPISGQHFSLTLFRSFLPPLGSCQLWSSAVLVQVRDCDLR